MTALPSSVTVLDPSNSAEKEWCAANGRVVDSSTPAIATTLISLMRMVFSSIFLRLLFRLDQILIQNPIRVRHALVLEQLRVIVDHTVQGHLDSPGPRISPRILQRRLVLGGARVDESESRGHPQLRAVL